MPYPFHPPAHIQGAIHVTQDTPEISEERLDPQRPPPLDRDEKRVRAAQQPTALSPVYQEWYTTSDGVVLLPTLASSSSAASLTSIGSLSSVSQASTGSAGQLSASESPPPDGTSSDSRISMASATAPSAGVTTVTAGDGISTFIKTITSGTAAEQSTILEPYPVTLTANSSIITSMVMSAPPLPVSTPQSSINSPTSSPASPPNGTLPTASIVTTVSSYLNIPSIAFVPATVTSSGTVFVTNTPVVVIPPSSVSPLAAHYTAVAYATTSGSVLITGYSLSPMPSATAAPPDPGVLGSSGTVPICAGRGVDSVAEGVLASFILSALVGLMLWLLFAFLRPRFRQLYAVREWFPPPASRSPPLSTSFFSFLHPPVPLVPSLTEHTLTDPPPESAFPSDEQLAQRTLWVLLRIVLGWSILGVIGCIPLYVVNTPCLGVTGEMSFWGGKLSSLTDLSVIRLLELLDADKSGTLLQYPPNDLLSRSAALVTRDIPGISSTQNVRVRFIILIVFILVLAVLPALHHLKREFDKLVAFRAAFERYRCDGFEMAWLNVERAKGLQGWSESRLKGLLSGFDLLHEERRRVGSRATEVDVVSRGEGDRKEVEVQGVFTIVNTTHLRTLIQRRDRTLADLEAAETHYIFSFKLHNPTPPDSMVDLNAGSGGPSPTEKGAYDEKAGAGGSRVMRRFGAAVKSPRPLSGSGRELLSRSSLKHKEDQSLAQPQTYLAPPSWYTLPRGSRTKPPKENDDWDLSRRVVGTRFQELMHHSGEELAVGSKVRVGLSGELGPASPDPQIGPNDPAGSHGEDWIPQGDEEADQFVRPTGSGGADIPPGGHGVLGPEGSRHTFVPRSPTLTNRLRNSWHGLTGGAAHSREQSDSTEPLTSTASRSARAQHGHQQVPSDEAEEIDPQVSHSQEGSGTSTVAFPTRNPGDGTGSRRSDNSAAAGPGRPRPDEGVTPFHLRARELRPTEPYGRPLSQFDHDDLSVIYARIKTARSELKVLNTEIEEAQREAFREIARGEGVKGWIFVGRGLRYLEGVEMIEGRSREDVRWAELQSQGGVWSDVAFWMVLVMISIMLALALIPVAALALGDAPDFSHVFPFLNGLTSDGLGPALAITLAPALAGTLFVAIALNIVIYAAKFSGSASAFTAQFLAFKATFLVLTVIAGIWLIAVSAVLFGLEAFSLSWNRSGSVADGSIYVGVLCLTVVLNLACIAPALLLLKPFRMWKVLRKEHRARTPRERFRAIYPSVYNAAYATGFCVIGIVFAATFSLLFPLIGPAIVLLILLSVVAHRFLVGYVYGRTRSGQTGGLVQQWIIRRFAVLLCLQPLLLGLLLLSRSEWALGGVLLGCGALVVLLVELYAIRKTRVRRASSFSPAIQNALRSWHEAVKAPQHRRSGEEGESLVSSRNSHPPADVPPRPTPARRGSIASILDMMAVTLAVMPPARRSRPVPLETEAIDDLVSTAKAAQSHPDAPASPPSLGPLSTHYEDPAEETAGLLYSPELLAPVPIVWLPDDGAAGVARAEAYDLQRYHGLLTILDVIPDRSRTHHT